VTQSRELVVYIVHDTILDRYVSQKSGYSHWEDLDACRIYHRESEAKSMRTRMIVDIERRCRMVGNTYSTGYINSQHYLDAAHAAQEEWTRREKLIDLGIEIVKMKMTVA